MPVTPLTMLYFAKSYLPRHDSKITTIHIVIIAATLLLGLLFTWDMWNTLTTAPRTPSAAPQSAVRDRAEEQREKRARRSANSRLAVGALLLLCTVGGAALVMGYVAARSRSAAGCVDPLARAADAPSWACNRFAADLGHASLESLSYPWGNLRRGFLANAQLRKANLEHADLSFANLIQANLSAANLKDATLESTVLWEADLSFARLKEAKVRGADLRGANLHFAELQGINFSTARVTGADFSKALVCGDSFAAGQVTTGQLNLARGHSRVLPRALANTLLPEPDTTVVLPLGTRERVPGYLQKREITEYLRWRDAWRAASAEEPDTVGEIVRDSLVAYLQRIDVSMAEERQRDQDELITLIGRMGRPRSIIHATPVLEAGVHTFLDKVREKALRHCVNVDSPTG